MKDLRGGYRFLHYKLNALVKQLTIDVCLSAMAQVADEVPVPREAVL